MIRLKSKSPVQIDEMVWAGTRALPLQGLTPEEIALVEGKS